MTGIPGVLTLLLFIFLSFIPLPSLAMKSESSLRRPPEKCATLLERTKLNIPTQTNPIGVAARAILDHDWLKTLGSPNAAHQSIARLLELDQAPRILTAGMEFGDIFYGNLANPQLNRAKVSVGGLASVINDLIKRLPPFLRRDRPQSQVSFAFPAFKGIPLKGGEHYGTLFIPMGKNVESVEVHLFYHAQGGLLFFLDHPVFRERSMAAPYAAANTLPWDAPQGRFALYPEFDDLFFYVLYAKAVASLREKIRANIFHGHDWHTSFAARYMPTDVVAAATIHNAGGAPYHGLFWITDFHDKGFRKEYSPQWGMYIPVPNDPATQERLDYVLSMLGIDMGTFSRDFWRDPAANNADGLLLKGALNHIGRFNLVAGEPVSQGYAAELDLTYTKMMDAIFSQKGQGPTNNSKVQLFNGGLDMQGHVLDGIENGIDGDLHASRLKLLNAKSPEEMEKFEATAQKEAQNNASININYPQMLADGNLTPLKTPKVYSAIQNPQVREAWRTGLNFGLANDDAAQVANAKDNLKRLLQMESGIEVNPQRPLFVLISRLVEQKHIPILTAAIDTIVKKGGQIVVGGPAGDREGVLVASLLLEKQKQYPESVHYFDGNVGGELKALIQAAGDFFPITSRFEPCGLTDLEAALLATISIVRQTGGLTKLPQSLSYLWLDTSDEAGEVEAFLKSVDEALALYKAKSALNERRMSLLAIDFSWDRAFVRYVENYRTAALYKVLLSLNNMIEKRNIGLNNAHALFLSLLAEMPEESWNNFRRLLIKMPSRSPLAERLLENSHHVQTRPASNGNGNGNNNGHSSKPSPLMISIPALPVSPR